MGLSGLFLKRKEDVVVEEIWNSILTAMNNAGYVGEMWIDVDGKRSIKSSEEVYRYENGRWISKNNRIVCDMKAITVLEYLFSEQYLMMYLPTEEELKRDEGSWFEWMGRGGTLFRAIVIENISGRGEMLLRFVEEYLKLNPDDIFYDDLKWYYTKDDIDKIIEKKVDPKTWYCINPAEI